MGKTSFGVADSVVKKLIEGEVINLEYELENFAPINGEMEFLCSEIQSKIRVWYLQETTKYTEAEIEAMQAKANLIHYAITVFNNANDICSALMSR